MFQTTRRSAAPALTPKRNHDCFHRNRGSTVGRRSFECHVRFAQHRRSRQAPASNVLDYRLFQKSVSKYFVPIFRVISTVT